MSADISKVSKTPQLEILPIIKSWFNYILLNYFCHQSSLEGQICVVRLRVCGKNSDSNPRRPFNEPPILLSLVLAKYECIKIENN